ncbi:MAG: ABC-F type ribosomal protection protein [Candidatus Promineifilaceae bacterium]
MSIITTTQLSQSFGDFDVFSGVSVSIPPGGKIGLVGPNGIGKTTLLLILAGITSPSGGKVHVAKNTRIGYLPQESAQAFVGQSHTVYEEMLTVFSALQGVESKLRDLETAMAAGDDDEALFLEYSALQEQFESAGGYDYPLRIKQVLTGLGFTQETWGLPLAHLSGGQKTRALLARLLLEEPDLLILDEPTNHLDVAAIEWLEGALKTFAGAVLIVSHDRYFLDSVVNVIWEMGRVGIETYRGNYTAYVQQREDRWLKRMEAFTAVQERFLKKLEFIKKNIVRASTTDRAKGEMKRLIREVKAVEIAGVDALSVNWSVFSAEHGISGEKWSLAELEQRIKALKPPTPPVHQVKMHLHTEQRSGELVLRTKDLQVGYPGNVLFTAEDIELRRLECAALIGPNGTGKTTFLKTILGQLPPLAGEVKLGASLQVGYFAQAHDRLNLDNTVLDELLSHQPMGLGEARNYLARFLFRGDDVYKRVRDLSGGERGRLALGVLALEGANFLLLDEPTNHLDILAQEALEATLEQFPGTILMVSHDRYLVNRLATQIWELRDGRLQVYTGGYQEYLAVRAEETAVAKEMATQQREAARAKPTPQNGFQLSKNEQRRLAEAIAKIEAEIHQTEEKLAQISREIEEATQAERFDRIPDLSVEYTTTEEKLERLLNEWEALAHE